MLDHAAVYASHQRARWMRLDAGRYSRPDAAKSFKRDTDVADVGSALADHRIALNGLRCNLTQIKSDLAWRRLRDALARKYSANQPRVPAGSGRESGRWTSGESGSGSSLEAYAQAPGDGGMLDEIVVDGSDGDAAFERAIDNFNASGSAGDSNGADWNNKIVDEGIARVQRIASRLKLILDEFGELYYRPKGHHEMPKKIYESWELTPETRRVFEQSTTGQLPTGRVIDSNGNLRGHYWDKEHRKYTKAVEDLANDFLKRHDIMETKRITPDEAHDLLSEIRNSKNPAIRDYNKTMRSLARIQRLFRIGRGNQ